MNFNGPKAKKVAAAVQGQEDRSQGVVGERSEEARPDGRAAGRKVSCSRAI
jgi:hypothetical protein